MISFRIRRYQAPWILNLLVGIVVGFVAVTFLLSFKLTSFKCNSSYLLPSTQKISTTEDKGTLPPKNGLLFVGVMTANKYVDTRAKAVYDTWGNTVPGQIMFFSSESTQSKNLPLVALPGVDDSYPPQKKSFLMFKYMHDHFLDKYEWFMRADDDVFVRTDLLANLLRSVNSSKPQYLGQAGVGNKDEFGQLSLERDQNFCMGGPGMILSRETLRLLAPNIKYCLKNLLTTHEDVEVGRCIRKFVNIPCTWSYEMQSIFFHSFTGEAFYQRRLKNKDIHRAITLHPLKSPTSMYKLQSYFQSVHTEDLRYQINLIHRQLLEASQHIETYEELMPPKYFGNTSILGKKPQLNKCMPINSDDIIEWDFFSKSVFSLNALNPKRRQEIFMQQALNDTVMEIMEMINKFSKQRGRVIDFQSILYGYSRVNPLYGVDYILDLLLTYKKYRGRKMTVPVRRHAYLQQSFSQPEIREVFSEDATIGLPPPPDPRLSKKLVRHTKGLRTEINFILPLSGRVATFQRFLNNLEAICLQTSENINLVVVLFSDLSKEAESNKIKEIFEAVRNRYLQNYLRLVETSGSFSRAMALEIGAKLFPNNALLFFIDVDIVMEGPVLERVRLNTKLGKQVYFPIVLSEYDPHFAGYDPEGEQIHRDRVYWRQFGFGIVSIYHQDLRLVGGLDTSIEGWGKEDVDLFNKVVQSNLTVFRAPDPGLVHLFHPINCNPQLEGNQYGMCWGSKLSSIASVRKMAKTILDDSERFLS